uniref:Dedicator of cytokinesis C/D N-terminal domain-containing protein n=1 Tax=Poecilia latipinna TaxID=48699 RepID=A0A3B3UX66_9TELE
AARVISFAEKCASGCADVQKHVCRQTEFSPSIRKLNFHIYDLWVSQPPAYDAVEPLDLEEFLMSQLRSEDSDLMHEFGDFPDDDLKVEQVEKERRTIRHSVPEDGGDLDPHVRDCVKSYTQPWLVVSRSAYSERVGLHKVLHKQIFESDFQPENKDKPVRRLSDDSSRTLTSCDFNLRSLAPDQRVEGLLAFSSHEELDRFNQEARHAKRHPEVFALYPPPDEVNSTVKTEFHSLAILNLHMSSSSFTLRFEIDIEPIFATMALYDLKEKKKISENFYCDLNSEQFRNFLKPHTPHVDHSTLARSAIFSVTYPSPDIYLVIKIEKVLQQGEISDCADPYLTMRESDSTKNRDKLEKLKSQAEAFCQRLGRYRMPFAWATVNIMEVISQTAASDRDVTDSDSVKGGVCEFVHRRTSQLPRRNSERFTSMEEACYNVHTFKPATITIPTIFKQEGDRLSDEDLLKFLADIKKSSTPQRRIKTIPGCIKLDMSPIHDTPQACLSTELIPLIPVAEKNIRPIKEVLEFPSSEVYVPHNIYRWVWRLS